MDTRPIFKIVGVGGGAAIAVDAMYATPMPGVSYALVDTSRFIIGNSSVPVKLLISPDNRAVVRADRANALASQHVAEIGSLFDDGTEIAFVLAGMGGVTGTGAAPTVARISKERNIVTIGIVTLPAAIAGDAKAESARRGIAEMEKTVDSIIVLDEKRLGLNGADETVLGSLDKTNEVITGIISGVKSICTAKAITAIDFSDVTYAFRNGGHAVVVTGEASGPTRVIDAIEQARSSSLAADFDFTKAKRLLIMLYTPSDTNVAFRLREVELLADYLAKFPEDVDIIWGLAVDENLTDSVRVTMIASSLPAPAGSEGIIE